MMAIQSNVLICFNKIFSEYLAIKINFLFLINKGNIELQKCKIYVNGVVLFIDDDGQLVIC